MKQEVIQLLDQALTELQLQGLLSVELLAEIRPKLTLDNSKDKSHGDLASNLALMLAKPLGTKPRELAERLVQALPASPLVSKVEIAGPGFINFFLSGAGNRVLLEQILQQTEQYGRQPKASQARIQLEFVSANPTGPLHVGHGRGAAYGGSLANLLEAAGYQVAREYYVNDAGRQMNILAASVWLRYLELCGESLRFPSNGYQGDYVFDIARQLHQEQGDQYRCSANELFAAVPADEPLGGDKEAHIDGLIDQAQQRLGAAYTTFFAAGLNSILKDIKGDLEEFGICYEGWFSENSLNHEGEIETAIERLKSAGHIYEKAGALWFKSTDFGDDKDRVVQRDNGQTTYFASDIAYHINKFERGYDQVINIWGADHHGYIARVKAALKALGYDPDRLIIRLVQFAILWRGEQRLQMSTRSGSFITLRELRADVGNDAARFFYVTRKSEQHMDFDLELAKSQSKDNPVYYIQYAHARACSLLRKLTEAQLSWDVETGLQHIDRLDNAQEQALINRLGRYPELIQTAAQAYEPHQLANYLRELAGEFHTYYNAHKMLVEDADLRQARVTLSQAIRQVIHNGLHILGVSSPEHM